MTASSGQEMSQEPMDQSGSEAVTSTDEPMQTDLGEEAGVRVVALDEAGAADATTILQVHVAMEAQPGQGDQVLFGHELLCVFDWKGTLS